MVYQEDNNTIVFRMFAKNHHRLMGFHVKADFDARACVGKNSGLSDNLSLDSSSKNKTSISEFLDELASDSALEKNITTIINDGDNHQESVELFIHFESSKIVLFFIFLRVTQPNLWVRVV